MKKYRCFCCGYLTMDTRGEFDICPVCFWEDDACLSSESGVIISGYYEEVPPAADFLDVPSGANHGLTLSEGQENFKKFGACELEMLPHVRKPKKTEI